MLYVQTTRDYKNIYSALHLGPVKTVPLVNNMTNATYIIGFYAS